MTFTLNLSPPRDLHNPQTRSLQSLPYAQTKPNWTQVLYTGLNASISGATFYFYTDSKEVYPAGPHFSDFFFNTVLGLDLLIGFPNVHLLDQSMRWKPRWIPDSLTDWSKGSKVWRFNAENIVNLAKVIPHTPRFATASVIRKMATILAPGFGNRGKRLRAHGTLVLPAVS